MKIELKFRAWHKDRKQMYAFNIMWGNFNTGNGYIGMIPFGEELDHGTLFAKKGNRDLIDPNNCEIMQYTGLKDKNGKEIYEGDLIRIKTPYRTTQTHTGDNIPNGSYTEPMEAGIKTDEGTVIFDDGSFRVETDSDVGNYHLTISDYDTVWDLDGIESAIQWYKKDAGLFDNPEEGDLQYLMELAKVETPEALCEFFNGVEIIGNIYETPELL
jgi:uncharacterized phage protein (TIGR01671 family)